MLRLSVAASLVAAVWAATPYTWTNIRQGAGGGFVPGIVFSTKEKGVAYARTDIGGAYRLNSDDSWTPITDWVDNARWNQMGIDALALDPTNSSKLYMAAGLYTNSWDPLNGAILISTDKGNTFTQSALPFKVGGNMPGRGAGERLVVDPNSPNILFFGARSGNGLYKSTDSGKTWAKVSGLPDAGTYAPDPNDSSGYNSQKIGVSFVTFDSTSASSGTATPRIFVGVASLGVSNVYVSNNGGTSFTAISGTNTSWIPHKGVLSPSEKVLYLSFSDGGGPYDGTYGGVYKYNITSSTLTNISPATGGDLYFGFGGLAVDLQKPGTLMVATLNCWWPDANIYRSTNGGTTWTPLWQWNGYPTLNRYYKYDNTLAPWTGPSANVGSDAVAQIGWMIEALAIDPFDSNHWLYGTGKLVYGGRDLLNWDSTHNVTLKALADGMNELAVLGIISPPSGPYLAAAVGDEAGFTYNSFTRAPTLAEKWTTPAWATSNDVDYAGNVPANWVRVGTGDSTSGKQVAYSSDSGTSWNQHYGAVDNVNGGTIAYSADADTILWSTSANGVQVSKNQATFSAVSTLSQYSVIASDKKNNTVFYAALGSAFYVSTNGGTSFTKTATLGASTTAVRITARWDKAGDLWVSTDKGLYHSTNYGTSFTTIASITQAWYHGLGAPAATGGYPAVYVSAIIGGVHGYWRSTDEGATWSQINDAAHGFGSADQRISGDPRQFGRVYISGSGRGIFVGVPTGGTTTTTTTTTSTSTSTTTTTTSTTSTTSTTTRTTSSSTTTTTGTCTSAHYAQCGGSGFTGCTTCASPYTCTYQNDFYSQCL